MQQQNIIQAPVPTLRFIFSGWPEAVCLCVCVCVYLHIGKVMFRNAQGQ